MFTSLTNLAFLDEGASASADKGAQPVIEHDLRFRHRCELSCVLKSVGRCSVWCEM